MLLMLLLYHCSEEVRMRRLCTQAQRLTAGFDKVMQGARFTPASSCSHTVDTQEGSSSQSTAVRCLLSPFSHSPSLSSSVTLLRFLFWKSRVGHSPTAGILPRRLQGIDNAVLPHNREHIGYHIKNSIYKDVANFGKGGYNFLKTN